MTDKRAAVERQNQPHADQASQFFADVANAAARAAGRALTFLLAVGLIVVWAIIQQAIRRNEVLKNLLNGLLKRQQANEEDPEVIHRIR
jgi:uncharacterized protein HemX